MDDTLENLSYAWVDYLNEKYGKNVKMDEILDWDMTKAFPDLPKGDVYTPLVDENLWKAVKPLPGAVETVRKLIDDGHKVMVCTASHHDTVGLKMNHVLFRYFPYLTYDNLIITYHKEYIMGDVLVDDGPHNFKNRNGHKILFTAPHNRLYDAEANGLVRANSWSEVYEMIKNIAENDN